MKAEDVKDLSLKKDALSGNKGAAQQLLTIYMKIDDEQAKYWAQIGAENGDPVAQYNLADILLREKDPHGLNRTRAIFWLEQSASLGDKDAQDGLVNERKP